MTNRQIKYEIAECLVTTIHMKAKMRDISNIAAMQTMEERLAMLYEYFRQQYEKDVRGVNDLIDGL